MDVSKIILTEEEQRIFDRFKHSDKATLTAEEFELLIRKGLIADMMNGQSAWFGGLPSKGECVLSNRGKDLRAYQEKESQKAKKEDRRYWITTGIAIIAIVISIIALIVSIVK